MSTTVGNLPSSIDVIVDFMVEHHTFPASAKAIDEAFGTTDAFTFREIFAEKHPLRAYELSYDINDETLRKKARVTLLEADAGKAYEFAIVKNDEVLKRNAADRLVEKDVEDAFAKARRFSDSYLWHKVGWKIVDSRPEDAYNIGISNPTPDASLVSRAREVLIARNPWNAYCFGRRNSDKELQKLSRFAIVLDDAKKALTLARNEHDLVLAQKAIDHLITGLDLPDQRKAQMRNLFVY